jgi:hypothetical protein
MNEIINYFLHINKIMFHYRMRDDDVIIFNDNIKEIKYLFEVVSRKPVGNSL